MELTKANLKRELINGCHTRKYLMSEFEISERELRKFTAMCETKGAPIVCQNGIYYWDRKKFNQAQKTRYRAAISLLKVYYGYKKFDRKKFQYDLFGAGK